MQQLLDILILGKGGREAALAASIRRSPRCHRLYAALPYGTDVEQADLNPNDFESIAEFCKTHHINVVVIGPEEPIVKGIRDFLENDPDLADLKIIAPGREAAALEGSKEFAKEFMDEAGIPSPRYMPVDEETLNEGYAFLESLPAPYVIKADGLASGKGVAVVDNLAEAKDILEEMILDGLHGEAGRHVLIEEYVNGTECTVMIATDGEDYQILPTAHDYKRLGEGDTGLNTAGMGAVSPAPFANEEFMSKVEKRIILPTLRTLKERGIDYQGFLYFGLMDLDGEPILLEYNVRLGDPETQAVLPRLQSDIMDVIEGIGDRTVGLKKIECDPNPSVAVVIASEGYPVSDEGRGRVIHGLSSVPVEDIKFYPGDVRINSEGVVYAGDSRVMTVVGYGPDIESARARAYKGVESITLVGGVFRKDIGSQASLTADPTTSSTDTDERRIQ